MPSSSATSAACNSSITLTRPLTATKSRGTQRDSRTSCPSDRPLQVPLRETCGTSRGHSPSAGRQRESSISPQQDEIRRDRLGPAGTRWDAKPLVRRPGRRSSADSDGEPACRRGTGLKARSPGVCGSGTPLVLSQSSGLGVRGSAPISPYAVAASSPTCRHRGRLLDARRASRRAVDEERR
jgi:hypothetical protein